MSAESHYLNALEAFDEGVEDRLIVVILSQNLLAEGEVLCHRNGLVVASQHRHLLGEAELQ